MRSSQEIPSSASSRNPSIEDDYYEHSRSSSFEDCDCENSRSLSIEESDYKECDYVECDYNDVDDIVEQARLRRPDPRKNGPSIAQIMRILKRPDSVCIIIYYSILIYIQERYYSKNPPPSVKICFLEILTALPLDPNCICGKLRVKVFDSPKTLIHIIASEALPFPTTLFCSARRATYYYLNTNGSIPPYFSPKTYPGRICANLPLNFLWIRRNDGKR
ncbi:unnamed protein product [Haemonchus placei]|uniref:Uncharacterized protein n=1 Tax=Haemonchus placei TaxID=6290 RepID=A0A0N4X0T2_HAEPC|nr:unnamed protein product [Haemonchus placei]